MTDDDDDDDDESGDTTAFGATAHPPSVSTTVKTAAPTLHLHVHDSGATTHGIGTRIADAQDAALLAEMTHTITRILEHYGDACDVQTCVALMLVLGEAAAKDIPAHRQLEWFYAYCELLDRRQLHCERCGAVVARASRFI